MSKVSIIIPSYNHSEFLLDRLESINNQTYKDWEAIIIDDKSTDDSVVIIEKFLENNSAFRVKHFIVNDINSGSGYNSWKKGIELAETEYIWIAETDDFCDGHFLEKQIEILDSNKDLALSFSGSNYVNKKKQLLYTTENRTKDLNVFVNDFKIYDGEKLIKKMPFQTYITNGSSVVFRKPGNEIPVYIFDHKLSSDLFLWTFLVQNRSFAFLNENLNFFRRHGDSTSDRLQRDKPKLVCKEKVCYLNYFNQPEKHNQLIDYYIKYYIWNNKRRIFNSSVLGQIQSNKDLKFLYFYRLIRFSVLKLLKKIKLAYPYFK